MAINITRLATCWGKLVGALNELNTFRATTLGTRATTLKSQYASINDTLDDDIDETLLAEQAANDVWVSYLGAKVVEVLKDEVLNDRPFADTSTLGLLTELARQMGVSGDSFRTSPSTVVTAAIGSPTGTPTFWVSTVDPYTGVAGDFVLPDVYLFRAADAASLSVTGNALVSPPTNGDWPKGGGVITGVTVTDPSVTTVGTDSGFESWTSPTVLSSWTTVSGSISQVVHGTGLAVQVTGTGGSINPLKQLVGVSAPGVYAVHASLRRTAGAGSGNVTIRLENDAGTQIGALTFTQSVAGLTGSFASYTGTLHVPAGVTGNVWLSFTTNAGGTDTIQIDDVALVIPVDLYQNGPKVVVFKGATNTVLGDAWTVTVTNTVTPISGSLIRGVDRLAGFAAYPVRLPTSGAPTQADALVS